MLFTVRIVVPAVCGLLALTFAEARAQESEPEQEVPVTGTAPEAANEAANEAADLTPTIGTTDVVVFAGALAGRGQLADRVESGTVFGLGVGRVICNRNSTATRATFALNAPSTLNNKAPYSGQLKLTQLSARVDMLFGEWAVRPFAGLAAGYYIWSLETKSGDRKNTLKGNDPGIGAIAGASWHVSDALALEPTLTWNWISGAFKEKLLQVDLSVRYQL